MNPPRKPTLFGLSESVYTRIALEEKGVEYTRQKVDVFAEKCAHPAGAWRVGWSVCAGDLVYSAHAPCMVSTNGRVTD